MRFEAEVRKDEDGYYVTSVPELPVSHTQSKSLEDPMNRIREVVLHCLETEGGSTAGSYAGVQFVEVKTCGSQEHNTTIRKIFR